MSDDTEIHGHGTTALTDLICLPPQITIQTIVTHLEAAKRIKVSALDAERGPHGSLFGKDGRMALPGSLHRYTKYN